MSMNKIQSDGNILHGGHVSIGNIIFLIRGNVGMCHFVAAGFDELVWLEYSAGKDVDFFFIC
jgi:hypothetical protein